MWLKYRMIFCAYAKKYMLRRTLLTFDVPLKGDIVFKCFVKSDMNAKNSGTKYIILIIIVLQHYGKTIFFSCLKNHQLQVSELLKMEITHPSVGNHA